MQGLTIRHSPDTMQAGHARTCPAVLVPNVPCRTRRCCSWRSCAVRWSRLWQGGICWLYDDLTVVNCSHAGDAQPNPFASRAAGRQGWMSWTPVARPSAPQAVAAGRYVRAH